LAPRRSSAGCEIISGQWEVLIADRVATVDGHHAGEAGALNTSVDLYMTR